MAAISAYPRRRGTSTHFIFVACAAVALVAVVIVLFVGMPPAQSTPAFPISQVLPAEQSASAFSGAKVPQHELLARYTNPPSGVWESIARTTTPIIYNDEVILPARKLVQTDLAGKCAFVDANKKTMCSDFPVFGGDIYVTAAFLTAFPRGCSNNELVLDVGSNVGSFTSMFRSVGCTVLAIEPQPLMNQFNYATLDANGWLHDGSVSIIEGFASNVSERRPLERPMNLWSPFGRGKEDNPGGAVQAGTMMRYVDIKDVVSCGAKRTEFVKLDIDGPEASILEDIVQLMVDDCIGSLVAEITWNTFPYFGLKHDDAITIFGRLYDAGFHIYHMNPNLAPKNPFTSKLEELTDWRMFAYSARSKVVHRVPRAHLRELFDSMNKMTKNIFVSKLK